MPSEYQGFNIPEKIIIVRKEIFVWKDGNRIPSGEYQGYVVPVGNDKMLETALNWADCKYEYTVNGKFEYIDKDKYIKEYTNGTFTLQISSAAANSTQSGKLSFWDCTITAEDGCSYLIGINSDLLCSLLVNTTFTNGVCQSKVYLGRQKGRVGAFTENMDEFIQSKMDAELRNRKMSTNYDIGQRVFTKTSQHVYLGEMYQLLDVEDVPMYYWDRQSRPRISKKVIPLKNPKKVYVYGCYKYNYNRPTLRRWNRECDFNELTDVVIEDKKLNKYFNKDETFKVEDTYKEYCNILDKNLNREIEFYKKYMERENVDENTSYEHYTIEQKRRKDMLEESIEDNKYKKSMYIGKECIEEYKEKLSEILKDLNFKVLFEESN